MGTLYIAALISIHSLTLSRTRAELPRQGLICFEEIMAGPTPANPFAWDIVVDCGEVFLWGRYDWRHGSLVMSKAELPAARPTSTWEEITNSGQSRGFLRWVRFPWLEIEPTTNGRSIYLMDARYTRSRTSGFGATQIELSAASQSD